MRLLGTVLVCGAVSAAACVGGGGAQNTAASASAASVAQTAPASGAGLADSVLGVRECDEYLAKYRECVASNVPAAVRPEMVAALDQTRAHWKAVASTQEGRAGLTDACTRAREAANASIQAYGCRW